jgi:peptidoglycan/xylan/chitin deacetylase (PgdA/CDA1 family)
VFPVLVPLLLLVGCGAAPTPTTRWVDGAGSGGGVPISEPIVNHSPSASPSASASPSSPKPKPSATPSRKPLGIPKFGPPPPPQKISLGSGPMVPWISRIPTNQKVAFITIDDGWVKNPDLIKTIRDANVPVTLFLSSNAIRSDPSYFRKILDVGRNRVFIESHTMTHTKMVGMSLEAQKQEICGSADHLKALYGRRPVLFRPPFGEKDDNTLLAAKECGMKAAFFWRETIDNGVVRYQVGSTVRPGDILLMHFRERGVDDFIAALHAIKNAGLTPALLESYIP